MLLMRNVILYSFLLLLSACSSFDRSTQTRIPDRTQLPEVNVPVQHEQSPAVQSRPAIIASANVNPLPRRERVIVREESESAPVNSQINPRIETQVAIKVERDPFEMIPVAKGETSVSGERSVVSPAVTSLIVRAKADLLLKHRQSAIAKLERALRIDDANAEVWYLLAKAHYDEGNIAQARTMANKSLHYAHENDSMTEKSKTLLNSIESGS